MNNNFKISTHSILKTAIFSCFFLLGASSISAQTVETFTINGNWTVPAGVTSVTVQVWGAGGGGGGGGNSNKDGGGGGGGGGYSTKVIAVTPFDVHAYTVGAAGAAGAAAGDGGDGGNTTMLGETGNGGRGGEGYDVGGDNGGAGGAGGGGDNDGGDGGDGDEADGGGGGGEGAGASCDGNDGLAGDSGGGTEGDGGSGCADGSDGGAGEQGNNAAGAVGTGVGAGGGGGTKGFGGGAGFRGQIIITYTAKCDPCYSIASGDWDDPNTWSDASGGAAQTVAPANDGTIAFIVEGSDVINVDGDWDVESIIVGATGVGTVSLVNAKDITFYAAAGLDVNAGSTLLDDAGNDSKLIFDQGVTYTLANDGTFEVGIIEIDNGDDLNISGGSVILISDKIDIKDNNTIITNNNTGSVQVTNLVEVNAKIFTLNNNGTFEMLNTGSYFDNCAAGEVTITQGAGAILKVRGITAGGDDEAFDPDITLNSSAANNEVHYTGTNQKIHDPTGNDYHHLFIGATDAGNKTAQALLDIAGNLTIADNSDLLPNGNNIEIAGNWVNNEPTAGDGFTQGTVTVTFDGGGAQSISHAGTSETFYNVTINNGGNTVSLNDDIEITNVLDFLGATGYIDINGNDLTMSTWVNGEISNSSTTAFIIVDQTGFIRYSGIDNGEIIVIPMGLASGATNYARANITLTDAGDGNFSANLCDQLELGGGICTGAADIAANAVDYTWNLVSTSTDAITKLYWDSSKELAGFDRTNCTVAHHNGAKWEIAALNPATSEGGTMYSRTGWFDGFSPYAVEDSVIVLPITLSNFTAIFKNNVVEVAWATETETNNDYFIVEKSEDGFNFTEVVQVNGAGNSKELLDYSFTDNTPYKGTSYYRLTQVDYDGKAEVFNIVAVSNKGVSSDKTDLNKFSADIYPNPVQKGTDIKVVFNDDISSSNILLLIVDVIGKEHYVKADFVCCDSYTINTDKLSNGIYYVVATSEGKLLSRTFIVE